MAGGPSVVSAVVMRTDLGTGQDRFFATLMQEARAAAGGRVLFLEDGKTGGAALMAELEAHLKQEIDAALAEEQKLPASVRRPGSQAVRARADVLYGRA